MFLAEQAAWIQRRCASCLNSPGKHAVCGTHTHSHLGLDSHTHTLPHSHTHGHLGPDPAVRQLHTTKVAGQKTLPSLAWRQERERETRLPVSSGACNGLPPPQVYLRKSLGSESVGINRITSSPTGPGVAYLSVSSPAPGIP